MNLYPKGTLIINTWSSTCADCDKDCDPHDETHRLQIGYGVEGGIPGCGVRWEHVTTQYVGLEERVAKMRPDLKYAGSRLLTIEDLTRS